jgi:hypothetical protein
MAKTNGYDKQLLLDGNAADGSFGVSVQDLGWIFHPDNIKMVTLDGTPVSQSVHRFWREIGGTQGLARALQTDVRKGIRGTPEDLAQRRAVYGANIKRIPKIKTLFELTKEAFSDFTLQLLIILGTINVTI